MNRKTLISEIASITGMSEQLTARFVRAFEQTVTKSLAEGDTVKLIGFGKFSTRVRNVRTGVNPRTGAPITIQSATVPKFTPGKLLKDACVHGTGNG